MCRFITHHHNRSYHYDDFIMSTIASQITSLTIVYSTVYSGADQSKHQSSASLAFVRGIHRGPVNSPHKWPVTRKMFPFDDVIMWSLQMSPLWNQNPKNPVCWFNKKMPFHQYINPHFANKTSLRPFIFTIGFLYLVKRHLYNKPRAVLI